MYDKYLSLLQSTLYAAHQPPPFVALPSLPSCTFCNNFFLVPSPSIFGKQEEQKDALIGLARERDEFELCIKELRARNSWLEKQVLRSPEALRCVRYG